MNQSNKHNKTQYNAIQTSLTEDDLENDEQQSPDGVDEESDNADSVGDAVSSRKSVPESPGSSDVLLQQVTSDDEAYHQPDPVVPYRVRKQARSHHR